MRKVLLSALVALAAAACGGDNSNEPAFPEVEGTWAGPINTGSGSGNVTLTLTETNGSVSGTGNFTVPGDAFSLTVTGNYAPPNVSLQASNPQYEPMNFQGTVGEQTFVGTLNGSGFVNISVTLTRQ
jgi:hypothetical protein